LTDAGLGPLQDRQAHVAQEQELARRTRQRSPRIEAGEGRKVALDHVRTGFEVDVVPRGVDRDPRIVLTDRDQDVVARDRHGTGGLGRWVADPLPGCPVEGQ
jgi:hypothetical protein